MNCKNEKLADGIVKTSWKKAFREDFSRCFRDDLMVKKLVFMRVFAIIMKFSCSIVNIEWVFFYFVLHESEVEKKITTNSNIKNNNKIYNSIYFIIAYAASPAPQRITIFWAELSPTTIYSTGVCTRDTKSSHINFIKTIDSAPRAWYTIHTGGGIPPEVISTVHGFVVLL